jgi:hypothetical protein
MKAGDRDQRPEAAPEEEAAAQQRSQAALLVEIANEVECFRTPDGEPFSSFHVDQHKETWPLRSQGFKNWLAHRFYRTQQKPPSSKAVDEALSVLEGKALYEGRERQVAIRVAGGSDLDDAFFLDLGGDDWAVVEIAPFRWAIRSTPPVSVRLRRSRAMLPLPRPERGGNIDDLRCFLNLSTERDFQLTPGIQYPILVLKGEQGTAKSTTSTILKSLIDPSKAPTRSDPREERDLMASAVHNWCLAYDNLSRLPEWLSNALCRLSTGGGVGGRAYYTTGEEYVLEATRPVIVNGIPDLLRNGDILDRAITIELPVIPATKRKTAKRLWAEFEAARPRILGALLDGVAQALADRNDIILDETPRMGDFAILATAAEPALGWGRRSILRAYREMRGEINSIALESLPIAAVLFQLAQSGKWEGTPTQLLKKLNQMAGDEAKHQQWPKDAARLGGDLRKVAPYMREIGVTIQISHKRLPGKSSVRWVMIERESVAYTVSSDSTDAPGSQPSETDTNSHSERADGGADGEASSAPAECQRGTPQDHWTVDGADSADGDSPTFSSETGREIFEW